MKLDLSAFKYLSADDFRVLTAIELGLRNHEIVPVGLIESIARLKRSNTFKVIQNLLKFKLIEHSNLKYDGYALNYSGYDYLAIHSLMRRGVLVKIGAKLGVGKESDVFICYVNPNAGIDTELTEEELDKLRKAMDFVEEDNEEEEGEEEEGEGEEEEDNDNKDKEEIVDTSDMNKDKMIDIEEETKGVEDLRLNEIHTRYEAELEIMDIKCQIAVLKLARLGRTSFRAVKNKRDFVKNKSHYNWLYLSRLSATNEFKFLKGLYVNGFPVPKPFDHNRHGILMQFIPSYPLCRVEDLGNKEKAYNELISILLNMASKGLIHGDFNEFNILVDYNQKMWVIDFPQMISMEHEEAKVYFDRDLHCINKFFRKKYAITFDNNKYAFDEIVRKEYLDLTYKAYGYENVVSRLRKEDADNKVLLLQAELEKEEEENSLENEDEDMEKDKEEFKDKKEKKKKSNKKKEILDFDKEEDIDLKIGEEENHENPNEVKISIKDKVKKMISKQLHKRTGGKTNRFKTKGKGEKIES